MSYTKNGISVGEPGRDRGVWMTNTGRRLAIEDDERREYLAKMLEAEPKRTDAKRYGAMSRTR